MESKREKNKRQGPGDAMPEKQLKEGQAKRLRRRERNQEKRVTWRKRFNKQEIGPIPEDRN